MRMSVVENRLVGAVKAKHLERLACGTSSALIQNATRLVYCVVHSSKRFPSSFKAIGIERQNFPHGQRFIVVELITCNHWEEWRRSIDESM